MVSAVDKLELTLAMGYYEHTADLTAGRVPVEGVSLRCLDLPAEEIFYRFTRFREWHVSEMSLAKYVSLVSAGDQSMVGLPVFPSRVFRHSAFYVRAGELTDPAQLRGKRLGLPDWSQTTAVYGRALLTYEWGIPPGEMEWYQAGVDEPGRPEYVEVSLPSGVRLTRVSDRCLNDMLLDGSIDAVLSARPPRSFSLGDLRIARLIADPAAAEEDYARRAGIVPIMHLVVLRRDVADAHPWIAGNLLTAFEEARARSLTRLGAGPAGPGSRVPLLWTDGALAKTREIFGCEPWPYGVEANRRTLDAFARWAHEQGVARRLVAADEMFPEALRSPSRI
jgi:4,5-dihydroxyphthalate decarboxylase